MRVYLLQYISNGLQNYYLHILRIRSNVTIINRYVSFAILTLPDRIYVYDESIFEYIRSFFFRPTFFWNDLFHIAKPNWIGYCLLNSFARYEAFKNGSGEIRVFEHDCESFHNLERFLADINASCSTPFNMVQSCFKTFESKWECT